MIKHKGVFITGTDTGVGKTYIAAGIAADLTREGVDVGVMKPAETGCRIRLGKLIPADALLLAKAAGVKDSLEVINPYRLREPVAPSIAADLEGRAVKVTTIMEAYRELCRRHEFLIVEGAGGIMVPLRGAYLYLDLAKAMKLPVLIVARPGLGTINHSLLTVSALQARGVHIAGIVLNHARATPMGLAERTNKKAIERLTDVPVLETVLHQATDFVKIANYLREDPIAARSAGFR